MLVELHIRNIVLITDLRIGFSDGMCVLTGETGAGKSILLDALSLALGARGDGALVRQGAESGQVRAMFSVAPGHNVVSLLRENDLLDSREDSSQNVDIFVRRSQSADGRTRAWINDIPVSVNLLRQIGNELVEIHGQHDDRALVESSTHRDLLDAFGALREETKEVEAAWQSWKQAEGELVEAKDTIAKALEEGEYLRDCVAELTALSPEEGEEEKLAEQRQKMMQAEKIAGELNEANEVLSGQNSSVPVLSSLARKLERKTQQAPGLLENAITYINEALDRLYDAQSELDLAMRASEFDQSVLDSTEERLFALRAASRKYGVAVENLPALAVEMADKVMAMDDGEAKLAKLSEQAEVLKADYFGLAKKLSAKRENCARALEADVQKELPSLKLENARFIAANIMSEENAGPTGMDHVEFLVQTNPGTREGPMFKVASGGELSRFLLALKVALADKGSAPCLVFDEIDTGVGGSVADAIGRRLARLAEKVQVLSVTHAPQVAALAGQHLHISKGAKATGNGEAGNMSTAVSLLDDEQRRDEIARMLAGATISDEARAAASKLLESTR